MSMSVRARSLSLSLSLGLSVCLSLLLTNSIISKHYSRALESLLHLSRSLLVFGAPTKETPSKPEKSVKLRERKNQLPLSLSLLLLLLLLLVLAMPLQTLQMEDKMSPRKRQTTIH